MKTLLKYFIAFFMRFALWFRYKVEVKGLENLNSDTLDKPGGVLFLPNHPTVFVDPTLVTVAVWPKFPIRPMIVEYQYYLPVVNSVMRALDALPIPDFNVSSNSLKRRKSEKVIGTVIQDLRAGQNFLLYPAGKTKSSAYEAIGGASAVHRIISEAPEANIVLVRIKGLWGSSFSRALTGHPPAMFPTIWAGMKHVFKNLLLFTPRRHVTIEFFPAPADFPLKGTRLEINKYLELWYNQPDGLTQQQGKYPGDSLVFTSFSLWGQVIPEIKKQEKMEENFRLENVPNEIKDKILAKIGEMTGKDPSSLKPELNLSSDLAMDSLDIAEVAAFVQDSFDIAYIPYHEVTYIGKLMAIADKQIVFKEEIEEEHAKTGRWTESRGPKKRLRLAEGKTIPEVFLNSCHQFGNLPACSDMRSGVLTYSQMKMRVLLLADYIRKLPGEYIGILLPSTVAANVLILAVQMAGKVPLLVNWTIGPRHLESVVKLSNVKIILSSWAFLDKLENADLVPIEDILFMLEDLRHEIGLKDKLKAFFLSKMSAKSLMRKFGLEKLTEEDKAVLLFTSGTESMPKGVPLSHKNVISNQKGAFEGLQFFSDDVLLGMLPPFHAFGFSITSLIPLLGGLRVAYSPDPTDGKRLAKAAELWKATILCGTPTFIKGIIKAAAPDQLRTVRLCFTGAEKAPPELFQLMKKYGGEDFFLEGYGITECSPVLTFNRQGMPHRGVGIAAPEVELLIVHPETNEPLPLGTTGMILARGPNIFSGYLNPGLASPFVEVQGKKWYRTGDLGFLDSEGFLTISGRLKRFIKIGAEMVSLASIEDGLLQMVLKKGRSVGHEGAALAVCAVETPGEKPRIYLFTTFEITLDEVNAMLKEAGFSNLVKIANSMRLAEIPLMGSGKINYRLMESEYIPRMEKKFVQKETFNTSKS